MAKNPEMGSEESGEKLEQEEEKLRNINLQLNLSEISKLERILEKEKKHTEFLIKDGVERFSETSMHVQPDKRDLETIKSLIEKFDKGQHQEE